AIAGASSRPRSATPCGSPAKARRSRARRWISTTTARCSSAPPTGGWCASWRAAGGRARAWRGGGGSGRLTRRRKGPDTAGAMLLAIDVGNTNTVLGVFEAQSLRDSFRVQTEKDRTGDEYGLQIKALFDFANLRMSAVHDVIISSVVPPMA